VKLTSAPHSTQYLLDLNALIALADPDSEWHGAIHRWYDAGGKDSWGVCPLTEAGFIRVTTNPKYRGADRTVEQAAAILAEFSTTAGYRYWGIRDSWASLTAPFAARITGHQQVTDAYLLGLVIKENGVLVTFDTKIAYLAGAQFGKHLLTLS
jgi:hypothetical protein